MKFRTIFILFNAVVAFCFIFLFVSPTAVLGASWTLEFWAKNWPMALIFLAILAILNAFFIRNARLFALLEREDWPALSTWMDGQIHGKGRLSARNARIHVNTLLLLSDSAGIDRLEKLLSERKPALLERLALPFGTARLLSGKDAATEPFLERYAASRRAEGSEWIAFLLAFCRTRLGKHAQAAAVLRPLLSSRRLVLRGLAARFLSLAAAAIGGAEGKDLAERAERTRAELSARGALRRWERSCSRERQDIQGVVFSRFMEDAAAWIRGESGVSDAPAPEAAR